MKNDRRKEKNHRLRQLIVVGNLMEVELNALAARSEDAPLTAGDRERLKVLQEAWTGSLDEFRKHLHAVPIRIDRYRKTLGGAA